MPESKMCRALGMGRLGGIGGPLLIGVLLSYYSTAPHILYAAALLMLLAGLLMALLGRLYGAASRRLRAIAPREY
jgi:AAHS family 4-hydroxybenzoate transporter-like MFS transporter